MLKRHFLIPLMVALPVCLWQGPARAQPTAASVPAEPAVSATTAATAVTLRDVLRAAAQNLDVSLAQRTLDAAKGDVLAANRAPLPTLSASTTSIDLQNGNGSGSWLQERSVDKSVGLDWMYERGNKRVLRTQSSEKTALASMADVQSVRTQQQIGAAAAFFDVLAAQQRLDQIQAIASSYAELTRVAQKRFSAGDLSAQDAARIGIESQRAQTDVLAAQFDKQRVGLALSSLMGVRMPASGWLAANEWPPAHDRKSSDQSASARSGTGTRPRRRRKHARLAAISRSHFGQTHFRSQLLGLV